MNTNELRVGNKVERKMTSYKGDDPEGAWVVVTSDEYTFSDMRNGAEYRPLIVTPERMGMYGFTLQPWGYVKGDFLLRVDWER